MPLLGGSLGEGLGMLRGGSSSSMGTSQEILTSSRMLHLVARENHLDPVYVQAVTKVTERPKAGSLVLNVTHTDPEGCRNILSSYVKHLKGIMMELNIPSVQNECDLLLKEINDKKQQLQNMEDKIQAFLEKAKTAPKMTHVQGGAIIADPTKWIATERGLQLKLDQLVEEINAAKRQIQILSESSAELPTELPPVKTWRRRLVALEYQLKLQEVTDGPESPEVKKLKEQIEITKKQLKTEIDDYLKVTKLDGTAQLAELVVKKAGVEAELEGVRKMAMEAPKEAKEFQRLVTESAILSSSLIRLRAQYDVAKMQEYADPNKWSVLDDAVVSSKPINKNYIKTGILAGFLGIIIGIGLAICTGNKRPKLILDTGEDPFDFHPEKEPSLRY
jgi:hypothetical protein